MVILHVIWMVCFGFFLGHTALAEEVKVSSQIDQYHISPNHPIKGTVMITHDEKLKVDPTSFQLQGKPLSVDFINDTKIAPSSPTTVSIYHFEIEAQPAGLRVLPEISVKVGDQTYKSAPSTYEVSAANSPEPSNSNQQSPINQPTQTQNPSSAPVLKLEASYEGPTPLFPGQRGKLIYRYAYSGDIELSKENLPLFEAKGLLKIGEQQVKDYQVGNLNIEEITQVVQGDAPGEYKYGPSSIEGRAYQEDYLGGRNYSKTKLTAEAPIVTVIVKPFAEANKPASFNGAIGKFTFQVSSQSPSQVIVGDKVVLSIAISSDDIGALENVSLPDLCCQPGFSGMFRLGDLPPAGVIRDSTKSFTVEMRPLSTAIKEIPSIEFSFFNPETQQYTVLHSKPIPLAVVPMKKQAGEEEKKSDETDKKIVPWPEIPTKPPAIEIESNFILNVADLYNLYFGTWWVLLLIPFGVGILWFQEHLRIHLLQQKKMVKIKKSADFFAEAFLEEHSKDYYHVLAHALILRLYEHGIVPSSDVDAEMLPKEGIAGEVRAFLLKIEEQRFAGGVDLSKGQIASEADRLFKKIGKS